MNMLSEDHKIEASQGKSSNSKAGPLLNPQLNGKKCVVQKDLEDYPNEFAIPPEVLHYPSNNTCINDKYMDKSFEKILTDIKKCQEKERLPKVSSQIDSKIKQLALTSKTSLILVTF